MKKAYGGVVIDRAGRVLLREPSGHYNGHVWTFAKGGPNLGETPEQTALREVLEETGIRGCVVQKIPGTFDGSTTSNEFFLMVPIEDTGRFDWETLTIRWASKDEARRLIGLTEGRKRRARDLRILEAAYALFESMDPASQDCLLQTDPGRTSASQTGESDPREAG